MTPSIDRLQHGSGGEEGGLVGRWNPTGESTPGRRRCRCHQNRREGPPSFHRTGSSEHNKSVPSITTSALEMFQLTGFILGPSSRVADSETLQTARRVVDVVPGSSHGSQGRNSTYGYASSVINSTGSQRSSRMAPAPPTESFPAPPRQSVIYRMNRTSMPPPPNSPPPPNQPVLNWSQNASSASSTVSGVTLRSGELPVSAGLWQWRPLPASAFFHRVSSVSFSSATLILAELPEIFAGDSCDFASNLLSVETVFQLHLDGAL